jgi:di/tricarboxylate transporter
MDLGLRPLKVLVLFLPILIMVSLKTHIPASSIVMPMGFATIVGGACTSIGTSTNLLVVSVAADMGLKRFGMFDFLAPAAVSGSIGILYLWLLAPRIIPNRKQPLVDTSPRVFTAHLAILKGTPIEGRSLAEAIRKTDGAMKVAAVERGTNRFMLPLPSVTLKVGDHLVIRDTPDRLKAFEKALGGTLYPEDSDANPVDKEHPLKADDQQIAEVVVIEGSHMSYATPMAYKTNLLLMNAGEYTFNDFLRTGIPLVLIMWLVLSWLLPVIYGLRFL